jgi:hypothetical protein
MLRHKHGWGSLRGNITFQFSCFIIVHITVGCLWRLKRLNLIDLIFALIHCIHDLLIMCDWGFIFGWCCLRCFNRIASICWACVEWMILIIFIHLIPLTKPRLTLRYIGHFVHLISLFLFLQNLCRRYNHRSVIIRWLRWRFCGTILLLVLWCSRVWGVIVVLCRVKTSRPTLIELIHAF